MIHGPLSANTATEMHHIVKIVDSPSRRMDKNNWLSVCPVCHKAIEGDVIEGMNIRHWSDQNYDKTLREACQDASQQLNL